MKFQVYIVLLFSALIILLTQCKHDPTEELNPFPPYPGEVCFSSDIQPLIISTCAKPGCHDATYHKEDLTLTNYNSIRSKAADGELMKFARYGNSEMHVSKPSYQKLTPLDPVSLSMIKKWIDQGAPNSICNNCDTINVKYGSHISPFIQKNCLGCHSGSAVTQLTNYAQVSSLTGNGKLYCVITQSAGCRPMPEGGNKLSDCKIRMVKIWIDAGALNN